MSTYSERKERLLTTDWQGVVWYMQQIEEWLSKRPNIFAHDKDIGAMVKHMLGEVQEMTDEVEAVYRGGSQADLEMESGDVAFLGKGLATTNGVSLDLERVRGRVNGLGGKSSVVDYLRETVGNLELRSLQQDLEHLLGIWVSYLLALPEYTPPRVVAGRVMSKDNDNYPAEAFPAVGVSIHGEVIDDNMADLGFTHPRRQLRTIRDHLVQTKGLTDRKNGLKKEDFGPHLGLITAHKVAADLFGRKDFTKVREYSDLAHANLINILKEDT